MTVPSILLKPKQNFGKQSNPSPLKGKHETIKLSDPFCPTARPLQLYFRFVGAKPHAIDASHAEPPAVMLCQVPRLTYQPTDPLPCSRIQVTARSSGPRLGKVPKSALHACLSPLGRISVELCVLLERVSSRRRGQDHSCRGSVFSGLFSLFGGSSPLLAGAS